jgi:hypothetical protein
MSAMAVMMNALAWKYAHQEPWKSAPEEELFLKPNAV